MRKASWGLVLAFVVTGASALEVGLVTALSGKVTLHEEKAAGSELKSFVKLREGDRLGLAGPSRLQIVYFDGGRQETWQGAGTLEIGSNASRALKTGWQPEVKVLPAILVKQLSKTPSPDGNVKTGMIRMRSLPVAGSAETAERNYADLRQQAEAADHSPELYLLASYFELREFAKLDALLKQLGEQSPSDPEIKRLAALYERAMSSAKGAEPR